MTQRFEAQPKIASDSVAAGQQLRVVLAGAAQSLTDVEIQARQVRPRIEEALSRGGEEAERALESETARMNGHFQAVSGDMASVGRALDAFERRETSSRKQSE